MISRRGELRDFPLSSRLIKLTRAVGNRWRVERNRDKNPCSSTSLTALVTLTDSFTFTRFFLPNFVSISLSVLVFGSIDEIDPFRGESFVAFLLFARPFTVNSRSSFRSRSLMKMRALCTGEGKRGEDN